MKTSYPVTDRDRSEVADDPARESVGRQSAHALSGTSGGTLQLPPRRPGGGMGAPLSNGNVGRERDHEYTGGSWAAEHQNCAGANTGTRFVSRPLLINISCQLHHSAR